MTEKLFETALGIGTPWHVAGADFNAQARTLTIRVDFAAGSRFAVSGVDGEHPVHDTVAKRYRHLNFFQHECFLEVRTPRVKLPDGAVRLVEPPWAGKLSGFTLLFEALVLMLCQQMTFAAAARLVGESRHRVASICERYVELALADCSAVRELAGCRRCGAPRARGRRRPQRRDRRNTGQRTRLARLCGRGSQHGEHRHVARVHQGLHRAVSQRPHHLRQISRRLACQHRGGSDAPYRAAHRSFPQGPALVATQGSRLSPAAADDLDALIAKMTTIRTARAWVYKEQLREILARKQINVVRAMLQHWCTCVMRSKVEPMKEVATLVRHHLEGIVAWAQTRQTNGFLEALNGLFQAAKRRARGFTRLSTIKTVIFLIAGKLDFRVINPHVPQPT